MLIRCPGCLTELNLKDQSFQEKALLQCPECLYVFLSEAKGRLGDTIPVRDVEIPLEDATILTTDAPPKVDPREFQWNVPGASITIVEGDNQGVHRKLREDKLVVGRKGSDLVIEDKSISRHHCELSRRPDGWWIKDLGSTNGTFVNGGKIDEQKLNHLDEIRVGRTAILYAATEAVAEISLADREDEDSQSMDVTKIEAADKEPDRSLPPGREFILEYMTGKKKGRSLKLQKSRVTLGRADAADIPLEGDGVSRKHAMIEVHSRDQIYISDLASQNGTWLNGLRIRTTRLLLGDTIRMGSCVMKFTVQDIPG
jgi:pSer/pThr/pTyr-binding forkhead associated (FHA) protein